MSAERKEITTVGGGTGGPLVNEALLRAEVNYIRSIVTVMDSGGITGRMRIDWSGGQIAYSDGLRAMLSLYTPDEKQLKQIVALRTLLRSRNNRGQDLGYTTVSHFFRPENGFADIHQLLEDLTQVKFHGRVIPVTTEPTHIIFKTEQGITYRGEHELDNNRMSADKVLDMWLDPEVPAFGEAASAIEKADTIVYCCGSLHGSVLCNLLPVGVKEALRKSKAKKFLLTNLASTRNETHDFKPLDFVRIFRKYSGLSQPIDVLVVPEMTRREFEGNHRDVAARYASEHSFFLGWENNDLYAAVGEGVEIVTHRATIIEPTHKTLRHDPEKLAETFNKLF